LELRPPKGAPRLTAEELVALDADVQARLGGQHWASAAASLVLHFRCRPAGCALDAFTVACGCRFLGWLLDRALPAPPAAIVRTPISVAIDCATWLLHTESDEAADNSRDRRCIAIRLLTQFLLPIFDASGASIAKIAGTGSRVETLRARLSALRGACGRCGQALTSEAAALACGRCKQVRYCGRECQAADWKHRHKAGCLSAGESLAGDAAWRLVTSA